jgi:hypothetical protein
MKAILCLPVTMLLAGVSTVTLAQLAPSYEQGFLTDAVKLMPRTAGGLTDFIYAVPDIKQRVGKFPGGVFIDTPEVHVSAQSEYKGGKPEDFAAVSQLLKDALSARFTEGGYKVTAAPGPGVIVLRTAMTDLKMKKNKRNVLAYTPAGAVVKVGADALRNMMQKVDITDMVLQAELLDGGTGEVLTAIVIPHQNPGKRIEFEDIRALTDEYGARARCNLDNARVDTAKQINCFDAKARAARPALPAI